ncbi:MAG: twin-arginine translocation signal domain-containing protein, partial [Phycisphaerales bacterium]
MAKLKRPSRKQLTLIDGVTRRNFIKAVGVGAAA